MRRRFLLLVSMAGAPSCRGPDARAPRTQSEQASPAAVARLDSLVSGLSTLQGSLDSTWQFTGDNAVFRAIEALADSGAIGDSAVTRLVACMERTDRARIRLNNQPVRVGVACYTVLRRLAYHEEGDSSDSTGGLTPDWPGDLADPDVTIPNLRAAHDAWVRVVREKSYNTL